MVAFFLLFFRLTPCLVWTTILFFNHASHAALSLSLFWSRQMFILSVFGMDESPEQLDREFSSRVQAVASYNVWVGLVRDKVATGVRVTDAETGEVLRWCHGK